MELRIEIERRRTEGLPKLKGFIQSSPANPTGAMLTGDEVREVCRLCEEEGIWFISDEIYHGITFGQPEVSALACLNEISQSRTIIVNSFSKVACFF